MNKVESPRLIGSFQFSYESGAYALDRGSSLLWLKGIVLRVGP